MGIVSPIARSEIAGGADLHERAWRTATLPDGRVFAVPTSAQAHVLFIRKDWRTRLGLPVCLRHVDEVATLAKAFTERDPDGNGRATPTASSFRAAPRAANTAWFISSFLYSGRRRLRAPGRRRQQPGRVGRAVRFKPWTSSSACCATTKRASRAINASTQEANRAFISGQAGMYLSGPYHIAVRQEPGAARVEVVPAPAGPTGVRATLAGGELAFITRTARRADATRFIEFLISVEGQTWAHGHRRWAAGGAPAGEPQARRRHPAPGPALGAGGRRIPAHGKPLPLMPNWSRLQQVAADGFNATLARCDSNVAVDLQALNVKIDAELAKQRVLAR